jgi:carnitine 3-dehydrogenase
MTFKGLDSIKTVCIVGTGVIGTGWAARFLANGLTVVATDPAPGAEDRIRKGVDEAWPALEKLGLPPGADRSRLRFDPDFDRAVASADFIQENVPENEAVKQSVLARIDRIAAPDVLIASSSSGLLPSRIQLECSRPERTVIGHPFNPVYLMPLVEVLGGERTDAEAITTAMAFYAGLGMSPLHVRAEVPGYIADRLQEALWREALHLINDGVASTRDIDEAIAHGPGMRWAFIGTCLTYHLAGGDGGMAATLAQFGPALKLPWTHMEAPELSEDLSRRLVEGTTEQAGGRSIDELLRWRDDCLVDIIKARAPYLSGARRPG